MTDFSDRLSEVFDQLVEKNKEDGGKRYSMISTPKEAKESPLSDTFLQFDHHWNQRFFGVMRRRYRFQAGTDNPESYPDMHEKVKDLIHEELINYYFSCIAAGVQIGEETSMAVRRAKRLNRLGELFDKDEFRDECALQAMAWQDDYAARELIGNYLEGSAVGLAGSIGLPHMTDPLAINRAWDVWAVSGRSLMVLAYSAGEVMGKQNRENDVMKHAAQQMEAPDE